MVAGTEQENPPPRDAGALPWQEQLGPVDGIHNPPGLAQLSTSRSAWGPLATMAALPLYPVDCVLGLASNTLFYSGGLLWAAVNGAQQTEPKSYEQSTSPLPGEGKEK